MTRKAANELNRTTEPEKKGKTGSAEEGKPNGGSKTKRKRSKRPSGELKNTRAFQQGGDMAIEPSEFQRLGSEITERLGKDVRFKVDALEALQYASEEYLVSLFKQTELTAKHAKGVTIQPKDMDLVQSVRGDHS